VNPGLRDAFGVYLQERSLESFLAARALLMALPSYDPWSPELAEIDLLLDRQDWRTMRRRAMQVVDNWMLTPYIHECLALAHQKLGDEKMCALEAELFAACARGILMTGDGTAAHPYLVVRVDDAYGALLFEEKRWVHEREVEQAGRTYRVLTEEGGVERWFDLTDASARRSPPHRR
jgi:hypothetical protein